MTPGERRVALVTGANTGIGRVTAIELARHGFDVVLTGRSPGRIAPVAEALRQEVGHDRVHAVALDLASFASIRAAAAAFLALDLPLHVLVNNAGVAGHRGVTADGFEHTFGVNHLGPFLWTRLLLERLLASAPARIVNVASLAHARPRGIDFDAVTQPTRSRFGFHEYQVSKLANVLFTRELARRLEGTGVHAYAVHPGVVASDVWRAVPWPIRPLVTRFMKTVEEGARPSVHLATSDAIADENGTYYDGLVRRSPSATAQDDALARELWRRSAAWVGVDDGAFSPFASV